jgi:ABC-type uncharacterized transport system fused permease/ATPase subunit
MYLIYTFTSLMELSGKFTDIAGVAHRIAQLIERLNTLKDLWKDLFPEEFDEDGKFISSCDSVHMYDEWAKRRNISVTNGHANQNKIARSNFPLLPAWSLNNVSYSAPTAKEDLVKDLNITFSVGESVLIIGGSSTGCKKTEKERFSSKLSHLITGALVLFFSRKIKFA